jgi:death-on-curing protein
MKRMRPPRLIREVAAAITVETVISVHEYLETHFLDTDDPVSPSGIKNYGLLESAVQRQHTSYEGIKKYPDIFDNVATLMFGLTSDHPFHNGNKRTALLAGLLHLDMNGYVLYDVNQGDLYDLMLRIANHDMTTHRRHAAADDSDAEVSAIAEWLRNHAKKITRGERVITYRELWRILLRFGYSLGSKKGNHVEILQEQSSFLTLGRKVWRTVYKAPCPGDGEEVSIKELKSIRKALELDEKHGVDSDDFYDNQSRIDGFINEHRTVLRELAKV